MAMISGRVFTKFTTKQPGAACEHQETITLVDDNGIVNRRGGMGFVCVNGVQNFHSATDQCATSVPCRAAGAVVRRAQYKRYCNRPTRRAHGERSSFKRRVQDREASNKGGWGGNS
jgi:hypothetical protein